uniref:SAM domain-containing protein n=1 Tax=Sipha flava TaxID=143950 RepID=A0A2S2R4Y8_9HEMI
MDYYTVSKLKEWDLHTLLGVFKEQEIDKNSLIRLTESMIKELIPKIGVRSKFTNQLNILKQNMQMEEDIKNEMECSNESEIVQLDFNITEIDIKNIPVEFIEENNKDIQTNHSINVNVANAKQNIVQSTEQQLKDILMSSHEGKYIYECYQKDNFLTFNMRNKLVRLIIDHHLHNNHNEKISISTIQQLSLNIVQLFPNESVHTYFIPYKKENGHIRPNRGKLWDRYCNVRKDIRKLNDNISNKSDRIIYSTDNIADQGVIENDILWLKNNLEPMNILMDKWKNTRDYRYNKMIICQEELYYFKEFPSIRDSQGYQLIEMDFNEMYSQKDVMLYDRFPSLVKILPKYIKKFIPKLVKDPNFLVLSDIKTLDSPGNRRVYFIKIFIILYSIKNSFFVFTFQIILLLHCY